MICDHNFVALRNALLQEVIRLLGDLYGFVATDIVDKFANLIGTEAVTSFQGVYCKFNCLCTLDRVVLLQRQQVWRLNSNHA